MIRIYENWAAKALNGGWSNQCTVNLVGGRFYKFYIKVQISITYANSNNAGSGIVCASDFVYADTKNSFNTISLIYLSESRSDIYNTTRKLAYCRLEDIFLVDDLDHVLFSANFSRPNGVSTPFVGLSATIDYVGIYAIPMS